MTTLVNQDELSLGLVVDPPRRVYADYAGIEVQSGPWPKPIFLCLPQEERRFVTHDSDASIAWSDGPISNPGQLKNGEYVVFTVIEGSAPLWGRAEGLFQAQTRVDSDVLHVVNESDEVIWSGSYSDRYRSRHDNRGTLPREFGDQMLIQRYDRSTATWDDVVDQEELWCLLANARAHH